MGMKFHDKSFTLVTPMPTDEEIAAFNARVWARFRALLADGKPRLMSEYAAIEDEALIQELMASYE